MDYALKLTGVSKRYADFWLKDVDIELPSGCIMGFVGENGAGKSTTIKLILDLIRRDGGDIRVLGQDNRLPELKERIGVVLDESCFPENLSARDVNAILKNIYRAWSEKTFWEYIRRFSLPESKPVRDYSRGMRMKLAIAAALSHDAELLILDEATSGLDPIVRDEILDVFLEFIQDESHSIFMSSHIVSDLEKACDYIAFIHKGQIVFSRPKDELLEGYGLIKCSREDFAVIDIAAVVGSRKNSFGVEALVYREKIPHGHLVDRAGIEDIMLYHVREGNR
jgi:ABC-2 type transport system ATP-binding protein